MNLLKGRIKGWATGLACAAAMQLAHGGADTEPMYAPADNDTDARAMLQVHAQVRDVPKTGLSVGVFGGVNAFQEGDFHLTAPGVSFNGDTKNNLGAVAGIRIEQTWPSFSAITQGADAANDTPGLILPAMGLDLFWTGNRFKASDGSGDSLRADIDTFSFEYTPKVKFNLGVFRPYIGAGVGATYTDAGSASILIPDAPAVGLSGSSDDFNFSVQGVAGAEVFVARDVAFDFEYKYLYIFDPTFHGNIDSAPITYHVNNLGNQLFTVGLNYYF